MAITLKDYLKDNKSLQAVRKKLTAAQAALSQEQMALNRIPANATPAMRNQIQQRFNAAQEAFDKVKAEFDAQELKATEYFNTNIQKITSEYDAKQAAEDKDRLTAAITARQGLIRANQSTTALDNQIQDINDRINKTGKYAPMGPGAGTGGDGAGGTGEFTPRDYATELATTGQAVAKMSDAQRLALATRLQAAGYNVPITGVYNQKLIDAYSTAIVENQNRSTNFQQEIAFDAFLDSKVKEVAALGAGGRTTVAVTNTEEYNGSTWSPGGSLGTARRDSAGCGTQTAGLAIGGETTVSVNITEEYDGSTWTAGGTLNTTRRELAGCGTQTSALAFGGNVPPLTSTTEQYDGTSWVSAPPMATARRFLGGAGTQNAGLGFGGNDGTGAVATTEEFTGPQTTATASTLTTS